jgi:tRNA nucleotidyltransferase (CCA-adding enzyme)
MTSPNGAAGVRVAEVEARLARSIPPDVTTMLDELQAAGYAAYVVGGSVRDVLLDRSPEDWDLATDARPDVLAQRLAGAAYENRFGTVAVRRGELVFEITTFRIEHDYADFRRPHRVEFGDRIEADLARRDFTVNALAWGRTADEPRLRLVDPFDGLADLHAMWLRAVGNPDLRFREDALRMVRAVRFVATLGLTVEPVTLAAISSNAPLVEHLSGERIAAELARLLAAPRPSTGLDLAHAAGLVEVISPELAAQRGIPQAKVHGEDLWDHTLRTVDAAPADRPIVRLAALLHDIGKPATFADGHFHEHDTVGARQADVLLRRLRYPKAVTDEVVALVRHHMFPVDTDATDAAIRRFIRRIGPTRTAALFALRRADDIGSGVDPDAATMVAFRQRVAAQIAAGAALDRHALAIDGNDLIHELGLVPGPALGRLLDGLTERVIADPALNERGSLLLLAQGMLADMDLETTPR